MESKRVRLLIVDDSPLRREMLAAAVQEDPEIEVMGFAVNGHEAAQKALDLRPDVITMDIQMPVMNGFQAIEKIMTDCPCPIIVTSAIDSKTVIKALTIGAMDCISLEHDFENIAPQLINKIKIATRVKPLRRMGRSESRDFLSLAPQPTKVIAIGVSTGGPAVLAQLFSSLPVDLPAAIVVVQHMMSGFTEGLVHHLQRLCPFDVRLAEEEACLQAGTALIAPEHCHLRLRYDCTVELIDDTSQSSYVPSIDVMMRSIAMAYHENTIGVLLTGMGEDGVKGMEAIKRVNGVTLAQDERSSVIFGMNRLAIEAGHVDTVASVAEIGRCLTKLCQEKKAIESFGRY